MFFKYNAQLGPPYQVIVDTNFINFSIRNKLDIYRAMMDCLLAKCASGVCAVFRGFVDE
jgi:U3 small nucleolar RNA-associated protein 24